MAIISLNAAIRDIGVEEHVYVQALFGTLAGWDTAGVWLKQWKLKKAFIYIV